MADNRVFFVINKIAGGGFQRSLEGKILNACAALHLACTIEFTRHRGHATELTEHALRDGFSKIFAVGGDGTINEVATALLHTNATLGIIPRGSGNGLSRHLGIPLPIPQALTLLGEHDTLAIDSIRMNGRSSFNVSGIGFDAHIAAKFAHSTSRGLRGYAGLVLSEFNSYPEFKARVRLNGSEFETSTFILAVANSSQFGNNARVSPAASVCDGLIDVCFVNKVPMLHAPAFAARMFTGLAHTSRFVRIEKSSTIEIQCDHPIAYHIDGEPTGVSDSFKIEIVPASLNVMVPKGTLAASRV